MVEKDAKLKKNRRRGKRRRVGHNLSTDVNLDIPNVEGGPETAASKLLESSSSLEVYPDGIQRCVCTSILNVVIFIHVTTE